MAPRCCSASCCPTALSKVALSAPIVLVLVGAGIGLLPGSSTISPVDHRVLTEHLTEFCVLVALMGVGLALDRPAAPALLGDVARMGVDLAAAADRHAAGHRGDGAARLVGDGTGGPGGVLVAAVLAPTDPVLAADVQVEGPSTDMEDESAADEIDEKDEVRFALTSEAGLNDGLAFPFVYAAIFLATLGGFSSWGLRWVGWELVGKTVIGVVVGAATGWLLARIAFRAPRKSLRLAETGEPLLAIAATLLAYGLAEVAGGWGFLAVFACALAMRSAERSSEYHVLMHQVVERLERLLTLVVLLLLGVALTDGLLANLTWQGAVLGVLVIFVVRPVSAFLALGRGARRDYVNDRRLGPRERLVTAFFGVRGVGSIYYLAYATGQAHFPDQRLLWSTVAFTIVLSVLVHGVAATPVMRWLENVRRPVPVL